MRHLEGVPSWGALFSYLTRQIGPNVAVTRHRAFEIVTFLLAAFVCAALYKCLFYLASEYFSDGRFMTNLAMGIVCISAGFALDYLLSRHVVFRDGLRQEGDLARFFALTLLVVAVFLAISWVLQDIAKAPVVVARTIAGLAVLVASWPIERFWIFQTKQRLVRPWLHNLSVVALMVVISAIITAVAWLAMKVAYMYLSPVEQTSDTEVIAYSQDAPKPSGAIEAHTRINAIGCAQDGSGDGVDVIWDDAWFFGDPTVYNPDLAFASGVLAAFANFESTAYSSDPCESTELTDCLSQLGFDDVCTTSYEHRSTVTDNMATLSSGATDTVAYTIATKKIASPTGKQKTLVAVAVRGSYGSEWLSDFNIAGNPPQGYENDHVGFAAASVVVMNDLQSVLKAHAGEDICLLVCGHSRGAAVSNLLAARLDDGRLCDMGVDAHNVFAYTLACPTDTLATDAAEPQYGNIFNLLVASDIVPQLPLHAWGYTQYGRTATFPRIGDDGFDQANEAMCDFYKTAFGLDSPSDPHDAGVVDAAIAELAETLPSSQGLGSLDSMAAIMHMFMYDINAAQVLTSHYIPTYLAWCATSGDAATLGFE